MTSPAGSKPSPDEHVAQGLAQLEGNAESQQAEHLCNSLLQSDPKNFDALYCLGIIYFQRGNFERSVSMFTRALELQQNSDIYCNLGLALARLNLHQQAIDCYAAATALDAGNAIAYYNYGNSLLELGKLEEALKNYNQALAINPVFAEALSNRGNVLRLQKLLPAALASYDAAIAIAPENPAILNNRGVVMMELDRPQQALADYERALSLYPGYVEALYNKGNALLALGRLAAAKKCLDQAVAIAPDNADAHLNRALFLLLTGNFTEGWPEYEWRSKQDSFVALHHFSQPLWTGKESLAGKTILLYAEQGLGDTIQFVRYIGMVKALGASIILEVQAPLKSLMATIKDIDVVIAQGEQLPAFDYHCMLMSLPCAFSSTLQTIPSAPSYLKAANDKIADWKNRLQHVVKPRIGVSWSGNPDHKNDHNRSIPLQWLASRLAPEFTYISLQQELRNTDRAALAAAGNFSTFVDQLQDFSDLAALIANLDMVISVDTSVAHLAGALGKPVCILLPYSPDWRWMQESDTSPWYPTARLFRQPYLADWQSAIDLLNRFLCDTLIKN